MFTIQDGSGADSDANLKTSMSGYKYDDCNELTTLNLQYADLKNDRFPVFSNLKLTSLYLYSTGIKGGSPSGVKEPPILATRKIKKTIMWTFFFLNWLALINGRINSMAAPVVPIQLANKVPIKIIKVFNGHGWP